MNALIVFSILLGLHWIADFVLQTNWQARNKSKRLDALGAHVGTYTAVIAAASVVLFGLAGLWFALINGALHFVVSLAQIPPTVPAATMTDSGRACCSQRSTAA
jgi:hypothetical protein